MLLMLVGASSVGRSFTLLLLAEAAVSREVVEASGADVAALFPPTLAMIGAGSAAGCDGVTLLLTAEW